jgi:hypothetical protein
MIFDAKIPMKSDNLSLISPLLSSPLNHIIIHHGIGLKQKTLAPSIASIMP